MRDYARMTVGERDPAQWPLGAQLRAAMDQLAWSERATAKKAGVSPQTVANLLRGHLANRPDSSWRPTAPNVQAVVRALRAAGCMVSEAEWLTWAGYDPREYIEIASDAPARTAERLASQIKTLSPTERRALETIVDGLLRERGYVGEIGVRSGLGEETHGGVRSGHSELAHGQADTEEQRS